MKPALSAYLDFLKPYISEELISKPYLDRIYKISEKLPVLSLGAFECWLSHEEKRIDFNLSINPRINEQKRISDWFDILDEKKSQEYLEKIKLIQSFCNEWSKEGFFLKSLIGELSLVYDIQNPEDLNDVPWLYISFLPTFIDNDPKVKARLVGKTLGLLDAKLDNILLHKLEKALALIPPSTRISAIGLSRKGHQSILRMYSKMKTFEEILHVLKKLKWPGNLNGLIKKMQPWVPNCASFGLALDFNGELMEKVGIECHFQQDSLQEHLGQFTHKLCETGACTSLKREALIGWNGTFNIQTNHNFWSWPDRLQKSNESVMTNIKIKRMASFIKLVFEPDKPMYAKAYPIFIRPVHR